MNAKTCRGPERHLEAAEGYLMLSMSDQAMRELRKIAEPDLCASAFYRLLGEALREKEEHDDALAAFCRAHIEEPDDLTVLMGMAWCYKRVGRLADAITSMQQAYETHPDESVVLYNLSCYYALQGDKGKAISWLGRSLRMEPNLLKLIADEPDFDSLRDDPDFRLVISAGNTVSGKP